MYKGTGRICYKNHEKNFFFDFLFLSLELSLGFHIMCRLCMHDFPFPSWGFSNMQNNQIMLEFVQICRPYTLWLWFDSMHLSDSMRLILILFPWKPIGFRPYFLLGHAAPTLVPTFSVLNKRFSVYLNDHCHF